MQRALPTSDRPNSLQAPLSSAPIKQYSNHSTGSERGLSSSYGLWPDRAARPQFYLGLPLPVAVVFSLGSTPDVGQAVQGGDIRQHRHNAQRGYHEPCYES